jgi:serine phosphatase RsbU (regulator of sigma subunit)
MATTSPPLLVIGSSTIAPPLRSWMEPHGFAVEVANLGAVPDRLPEYCAVVLDGREGWKPDLLALCRRFAAQPLDVRPPLIYFAPDDSVPARLAGFAHGADAVIGAKATADEFLAQVRVLERWQKARAQWLTRASDANQFSQQLQNAFQQIELDLRMARRLQASFLPDKMPEVGSACFAVSYRPCGQVGGDFYDVIRLDEHHVGFYVADAMGHGVPASLLTVFLKKAVQLKKISESGYRLLPPDEVLARLNRDLIAQGLAELPFITMVYGLLDCRTGSLQFARAAHPYPLFLPQNGPPEQWQSPGTLLGIFEAEYPCQRRELHAGDRLLVYTDGLRNDDSTVGPPNAMIQAIAEHRDLPMQMFVDNVTATLLGGRTQTDDFTLLAIEFTGERIDIRPPIIQ